MAIYRYNSDSLIDEVRVIKNANGGLRANLHARDTASAEELQRIQNTLGLYGYQCVPITEGGAHYLEVRGLKTTEQFLGHIRSQSFALGIPAATTTADDVPSRKDRFRALTLKLTGYIYNVGDLAYMVYALMGFSHEKGILKEANALTEEGVAQVKRNVEAFRAAEAGAKAAGKRPKSASGLVALAKEIGDNVTKADLVKGSEGLVSAAKQNILAGAGYAIGGTTLSLFAGRDQSQVEIKNTSKKLQQFALRQGITAPQDSPLAASVQKDKSGPATRIKQFFARYPSEILNFVYTGVGLSLASHAYTNYKQKKDPSDAMDIGLGAITTASSLLGILVKEKKPIEGQQKKTGLARVWEWIEEKPLRATGYGFMIATAFHASASYMKFRDGDAIARKTIVPRIIFVASNVFAEVLIAISSKGHGHGVKADESIDRTVIANTADLIARQPAAKQDELIHQFSGYMASPEIIGGKAEDIAKQLREQVAGMHRNPWARKAANVSVPVQQPVAETIATGQHVTVDPKTLVKEPVAETIATPAPKAVHGEEHPPTHEKPHHKIHAASAALAAPVHEAQLALN